MDELMDIGKVQNELRKILADLEVKAIESADFGTQYHYEDQAKAIAAALEYLWMYEDLME